MQDLQHRLDDLFDIIKRLVCAQSRSIGDTIHIIEEWRADKRLRMKQA